MKEKIASIHAMEILDSRGNPTVHVRVILKNGTLKTKLFGNQREKRSPIVISGYLFPVY